jgi:hypothetical protein
VDQSKNSDTRPLSRRLVMAVLIANRLRLRSSWRSPSSFVTEPCPAIARGFIVHGFGPPQFYQLPGEQISCALREARESLAPHPSARFSPRPVQPLRYPAASTAIKREMK